jgi:hypothetical protein
VANGADLALIQINPKRKGFRPSADTIRAHFPTLGIAGDDIVTTMKPKKRQAGLS